MIIVSACYSASRTQMIMVRILPSQRRLRVVSPSSSRSTGAVISEVSTRSTRPSDTRQYVELNLPGPVIRRVTGGASRPAAGLRGPSADHAWALVRSLPPGLRGTICTLAERTRYSEAKSARIAKTLLRRLKSSRSKEDEDAGPIRDPREKKKIREKLRQAHNLLTKMDRLIGDLDRPFRPGRAEERALLKSAPYYRKSYALLRKAGKRPTDDETLNLQVRRLAEESRSKLAKLYVAIGRVYLSRGAIRLAEEYSARAYRIDADSESQRELQEKIVDSRILFQ